MILRSLALAVSALGVSAAAQAQETDSPARPPANPRVAILRLDANGDGVVVRDEVPESARDAYARILKDADRNNDGKLDEEELRGIAQRMREIARPGAARGPRQAGSDAAPNGPRGRGPAAGPAGQHPMLMMDTNGDGKISREEFQKGHAAMFDRLDRNKDGVIDESERPNFPMLAGPGAGRLGAFPFGPGGPPFGPSGPPFGPGARRPDGTPREGGPERVTPPAPRRVQGLIIERIRGLDTDGDGKISREEFKGPKEFFDRLDRNGDGVIDASDRPATEDKPAAEDKPAEEARPEARRGDRERPRDGEARRGDRERPRDGEARRGDRERPRGPEARRGDREEKRAADREKDKVKEKKDSEDKKEKEAEHEHEHEKDS